MNATGIKIEENVKLRIIEDYQNGIKPKEIYKKWNIKKKRLYAILKQYEIPVIGTCNYTYDTSFFKNLTEESLYWIGFLLADGSISKSGRLSLTLGVLDKDHVLKFKNAIKYSEEIKLRDTLQKHLNKIVKTASVSFQALEVLDDLKEFYIVPRKTYSTKEINLDFLGENINHVIRGFIDGDGSIVKTKTGWGVSIAGMPIFINFIEKYTKTFTRVVPKITNDQTYLKLRIYSVDQVEIFLDWIYKDAKTYLNRKYDRYLEFKKWKKDRTQVEWYERSQIPQKIKVTDINTGEETNYESMTKAGRSLGTTSSTIKYYKDRPNKRYKGQYLIEQVED